MQRRFVLKGALALAVTPAIAQSNPAPPTDAPAAPAPTAPAAPEPAAAPAMKIAAPMSLSDASEAHLKDTMAAGATSLAVSRTASDKVATPTLKQFVAFEIAEQETIADVMRTIMLPGASPSGTIKPPTDAELMSNLDFKGKATLTKMHEMRAGKAFEREYIRVQIEGHKTLLAIQQTYLSIADNLDQTNVAKLAKGMITEHLVLLGDLQKTIG